MLPTRVPEACRAPNVPPSCGHIDLVVPLTTWASTEPATEGDQGVAPHTLGGWHHHVNLSRRGSKQASDCCGYIPKALTRVTREVSEALLHKGACP